MLVMDIDKRFFNDIYKGSYKKLIQDIKNKYNMGIKLTPVISNDNVIAAFCGCVYSKDIQTARKRFKTYMLDNINIYSIFYDLEHHKILTVEDIKKDVF